MEIKKLNFEKLMVYSKSSAEKLRILKMIQMEKTMKENIFSLLMKLIELTYQKYLVS